jgi:hypothetical protein
VSTPPDDTASGESVAGWDSGWNGAGVTGWDYVGQVNGASGVYLGGGWVLTAGHVGGGDFTLNGTTYGEVSGSAQNVPNNSVDSAIDSSLSGTTADLTLFQISSSPTEFSDFTDGSAVVMIGYGGGDGETWGANNVTNINQTTPLNFNGNWDSLDFYTLNGSDSNLVGGINNTAQLVVFDSGGGDFIYNAATHQWELAGINEAQLVDNSNNIVGSAFVQLSDYAGQIDSMTGLSLAATPEPPPWLLLGLGLGAIGAWNRRAAVQPRRPAPKSRCTGPSAI